MSEPSCTPYLDCENTSDSMESLLKRLAVVDADGNLALNVRCCGEYEVEEEEEPEPEPL